MRSKLGNLDYIAAAQQAGKDVKSAQQVDKSNKRTALGAEYLKVVYSVLQDIDKIHNEGVFKTELAERTVLHFTNPQSPGYKEQGWVPEDSYRLLQYILMTQRRELVNLRGSIMSEDERAMVAQPDPGQNKSN